MIPVALSVPNGFVSFVFVQPIWQSSSKDANCQPCMVMLCPIDICALPLVTLLYPIAPNVGNAGFKPFFNWPIFSLKMFEILPVRPTKAGRTNSFTFQDHCKSFGLRCFSPVIIRITVAGLTAGGCHASHWVGLDLTVEPFPSFTRTVRVQDKTQNSVTKCFSTWCLTWVRFSKNNRHVLMLRTKSTFRKRSEKFANAQI